MASLRKALLQGGRICLTTKCSRASTLIRTSRSILPARASPCLSSRVHHRYHSTVTLEHHTKVQENSNQSSCGVSLEIEPNKKQVLLTTADNKQLKFHASWLRHNCHCPLCLQLHSGQKTYKPTDLKPTYTVQEATITGEDAMIIFEDDPHVGVIPIRYLTENPCCSESYDTLVQNTEPSTAKGSFPTLQFEEIQHTDEGLFKWLKHLNEYGVCLIKGVPQDDKILKKVAERIFTTQQTIYGDLFYVESSDKPINIAYSNAELGFHMDLVYYESPPGLQMLHCIQFDKEVIGGESEFVDSWYEAERMRNLYPEDFRILTQTPATFQKIHFDREKPVYMRYQRPHISVDKDGVIVAVTWAPPFEGPLKVDESSVEAYYSAYHRFATMIEESDSRLEMRLAEGDLITFNNRRILHARKSFVPNGGTRKLVGCYVNIDEFKSQFQVYAQKYGNGIQAKRVFNHSVI